MDRRTFIGIVSGALTAAAPVAAAQQPARLYRIGFLGIPSAAQFAKRAAAFQSGLRDLGYIEGKNFILVFRWADGDESRLPELASELVHLKVDVIVTHATAGGLAAKRATETIPIVMAVTGDAVAAGLATSLSHPGGNVTGSTILIPELNVKRLELLKIALPSANQVALLVHQDSPANEPMLRFVENGARSLRVALRSFAVTGPSAFESVFSDIAKANVDAVLVFEEPMFVTNARVVAEVAGGRRMPLFGFEEIADAGGLVGYGVDLLATIRHAAVFVDKILKGAKPADIPFEQASKFKLAINLSSAKKLGVTIPQSLLLRADEVIQ
jgi:putative ABC transport system substrate-binding protein